MEIPGEERGFVAPGAGADLDDGVAVLVRIMGQQGVLDTGLEVRDAGFERGDLRGGQFGKLRVAGLHQFLVIRELDPGPFQADQSSMRTLSRLYSRVSSPARLESSKNPLLRHLGFQFRKAEPFSGDEGGVIQRVAEAVARPENKKRRPCRLAESPFPKIKRS